MSRLCWAWAKIAAGLAVLSVLLWRLGTGPFIDGVGNVSPGALAWATGLGLLTTVCCAWRWRTVARGLSIELSLGRAITAYYRSLFLNVTLPGGIIGDVHRGISHGRKVSDLGRGLRVVIWERSSGQVVQLMLTIVVLLALPSPVQSAMPLVTIILVVTVVGLVLVGRSRNLSFATTITADIRAGLLAKRAWLPIAISSAIIVIGHATTFLIAARTAGVTASPSRMLPLALLAMLAMVLPSIGGWGPREGATAWVFGAAGLGADRGVATAVAYGVMVFAASLPGAIVLVAAWLGRLSTHRVLRPDGAADA